MLSLVNFPIVFHTHTERQREREKRDSFLFDFFSRFETRTKPHFVRIGNNNVCGCGKKLRNKLKCRIEMVDFSPYYVRVALYPIQIRTCVDTLGSNQIVNVLGFRSFDRNFAIWKCEIGKCIVFAFRFKANIFQIWNRQMCCFRILNEFNSIMSLRISFPLSLNWTNRKLSLIQ